MKNPLSIDKKTYAFLLIAILSIQAIVQFTYVSANIITTNQSDRPVHNALIIKSLISNGFKPLKTEIPYKGRSSLYVQEFPIYNLLVAGICRITGGFSFITGQVVSIIFLTLSGLLFAAFIKRRYGSIASLFTISIFLFSSITIQFGHQILRISLELFLITVLLLTFEKHEKSLRLKLISYFLLCCLLLSRPQLVVMIPVFLIIGTEEKPLKAILSLEKIIFTFVVCLITLGWYYLVLHGLDFELQRALNIKQQLNFSHLADLLTNAKQQMAFLKRLHYAVTLPGFILFITGLVTSRKKMKFRLLRIWLATMLVLFALSSLKFQAHTYYWMFLIFPMSIFIYEGLLSLLQYLSKLRSRTSDAIVQKIGTAAAVALYVMLAVFIPPTTYTSRVEYIAPLAERIQERTLTTQKITFSGQDLHFWKRDYELMTERLGFHARISHTDPESIISWSRQGVSYLACITWPRLRGEKKAFPADDALEFLYSHYPLVDYFRNEYLMFNLTVPVRRIGKNLLFDEVLESPPDTPRLKDIILTKNPARGGGSIFVLWDISSSQRKKIVLLLTKNGEVLFSNLPFGGYHYFIKDKEITIAEQHLLSSEEIAKLLDGNLTLSTVRIQSSETEKIGTQHPTILANFGIEFRKQAAFPSWYAEKSRYKATILHQKENIIKAAIDTVQKHLQRDKELYHRLRLNGFTDAPRH